MCGTSQALRFDQIARDHWRSLPDVQNIETNQIYKIDTNQMKIFKTNRTYKILKQIKPKIWKRLSSC